MITKLSGQGSHFRLLLFRVFSFSLFGGGALPEVMRRSYKLNAGKEVKNIHCEKRGSKGLMIEEKNVFCNKPLVSISFDVHKHM